MELGSGRHRMLSDALLGCLIDCSPIARLAVSRTGKSPWVSPIVIARAAGSVWSPIDGKPKKGTHLARVNYVRTSPAVTLLFDEYSDDWEQLWWVRVDAIARVREISATTHEGQHPGLVSLRGKYSQYESVPLNHGTSTLLEFEIVGHTAWAWQGLPWLEAYLQARA